MTSIKLIAVLLLSASALVIFVESVCPNNEDITPCKCKEEDGATVLRCTGVANASQLVTVAENSDGYRYDEMHIEKSDLEYIPKEVPEKLRMSYFALRNVTLDRLVDHIPNSLEELTNLVFINIDINNHTENLSWEFLKNTETLRSLIIHQVDIPVIKTEFNTHVSHNLLILYIQDAGIKIIEKGAFKDFKKLQTLSLNNNELEILDRDYFPTPSKLELLSLKHNKLTTIPEGFFTGMDKIRAVLLDDNKISTLDETAFTGIHTQFIELYGNPIKCNCFLRWITHRATKNIKGKCHSPDSLSNKTLVELTDEDFYC